MGKGKGDVPEEAVQELDGSLRYFVAPRESAPGIQNVFEPGFMRDVDRYRVRAVARDARFPFFILSDSGLGYMFKLSFVNGKSWDEHTRTKFLKMLDHGLKLESQNASVEYTYSFSCVRRPLKPSELEEYYKKDLPITYERVRNLQAMAERLEVQMVDLYFGICGSPSKYLKGNKIGFVERIKAIFDQRIRYANESQLLEDVVQQFGDKVKQVLALFTGLGIKPIVPKSESELLSMARAAWRPNYEAANEKLDNQLVDSVLRTMREDAYVSPGDFILRDLKVEQFKSHWIADGCLNMLFSLEEAPDPNIIFSSAESDRFLAFGIRPGVSNIPFFGTYTVAWSSMSREDGDLRFRYKNAFAQGMVSNKKGIFEDKMGAKEARDVDRMHEEYIEGGSDMVRACVMYQLQLPLEHLPRFFDANIDDQETIRSVARAVGSQLNEIGFSKWRLEDRTYFPCWLNSMPGSIRSVDGVQYLPRIYLSLAGTLHLVPFFATIGPDQHAFRGGNYFITEENGILVFDHFSQNNGTAANFSVCGATGSGKSVTVQSLVMMTEWMRPNIMILDFGGGNVGSWTKLCACWDGVELKFGNARPPRINPFQLAEADSFPNRRKRREIALALDLDPTDEDAAAEIEAVYLYLRGDDTPFTKPEIRKREIVDRCKAFDKLSYEETMELLQLGPGKARPGEKGTASIRIVLELLLATNVTEDGPTDNAWSTFLLDDINEAILKLYEEYAPPGKQPDRWPTLSDLKDTIERTHKALEDDGRRGVYNYDLLIKKLSNYCVGGLDAFLDGQTNVPIMRKVVVDGIEKEMPAKFILADMAGIADKRKLALYMVTINDFMSNILYNSKESRGIMIRDEAWLFMKSKIAAPYLEADYRLARKYGFSVITIAQQYSDFKSPVLQNNTQTWVVCSLASIEEINLADIRFKFNEAERDLFEMKRMGTKKERDVLRGAVLEVYSRIMISNQSGKYFVKNKIGKEELWITTTDANETFVFNYYRDSRFRGRPIMELIKWLCTGEYKRDPELKAAVELAGREMPSI